MAFFCDTSALVKRYVSETETTWLTTTLHPNLKQKIYVGQITIVEIASAIARRGKSGSTTPHEALTAFNQFEQDWKSEFTIVDFSRDIVRDAITLAQKYALRGYDAVQLSTVLYVHRERVALNIPSLTFLSADSDLNDAAIAEGLVIDDPNNH